MRIFLHAILCTFFCSFGVFPGDAFAQESDDGVPLHEAPSLPALIPVITGPEDVAVGRTIVLDASLSRPDSDAVQYRWYVGDGKQSISRTVEAVYTPEESGTIVFRLQMRFAADDGRIAEAEQTHAVTVYNRKILLIADQSIPLEKLEMHRIAAEEAGIFLRVLQPSSSVAPLGSEEALTTLIQEQSAALAGADTIVLWMDGISPLQSLMNALRGNEQLLVGLHNQSIIQITNGNLQTLERLARGHFAVLHPLQIVLTRKEAVSSLLDVPDVGAFLAEIAQRDIEFLRIDASSVVLRPWNLLSSLVNVMLSRGLSSQTVALLLMLPIIATILAFLKQVIGVTTFGLYIPSIITLSFLALGWKLGVFFLVFIMLSGYATRALVRHWRLLYIPKVAIIITVVSVTLFLLMGISTVYGITFSRDTIFILLIMSTLAESFVNLKAEQGWLTALRGIVETILAALACVFIVQWPLFQSILLAYPELILLTIAVNFMLGRWTGLRLVEFVRFREVFKHLQEE